MNAETLPGLLAHPAVCGRTERFDVVPPCLGDLGGPERLWGSMAVGRLTVGADPLIGGVRRVMEPVREAATLGE